MSDIEVTVSGPLFQGRAPAVMARAERAVIDAIAAQVYAQVMTNLNASIRNPTPYYETQITVERLHGGKRIHDRGIVYGPWLEGTDPRNQTTSFRGYRSFGRAREQVAPQAQQLAEHAIRRHLRELG